MAVETYRFKLGDFDCIAINDGILDNIDTPNFFAGSTPDELQVGLARHGITTPKLPIPVIILYVNTGTHQILIDSGCGAATDPKLGLLLAGLQAEGVQPDAIDIVTLSHGHWDHVAGNTVADGSLAFPNARYVMDRAEYAYWTEQGNPADNDIVYHNLIAVKDQLDLIEPNAEIVPGLQAIATPGHTLHHTSFVLTSGFETLYCLIDVVDHPLHFEEIGWTPNWDLQPEQSVDSRQRIFSAAVQENALVHGLHLPFPGLGRLTVHGAGWHYLPV